MIYHNEITIEEMKPDSHNKKNLRPLKNYPKIIPIGLLNEDKIQWEIRLRDNRANCYLEFYPSSLMMLNKNIKDLVESIISGSYGGDSVRNSKLRTMKYKQVFINFVDDDDWFRYKNEF